MAGTGVKPLQFAEGQSVDAPTEGISYTTAFSMADQNEFRFYEPTSAGTNYVALKAPDTLAGDVTWKLPNADGSAGQVWKTDGAGNLGWADSTDSQSTTSNGSRTINSGTALVKAYLTIDTGHTYTVDAGGYFHGLGTITVDGTLTINGTARVV